MASQGTDRPGSGDHSNEVPTVLVRDRHNRQLLCFLEQLIPLDGHDYALLTPVDTPVCLFRLHDEDDPELIDTVDATEPILSVADVVLQEHDLTLVRSAVTLTVSGELDEPEPDEEGDEDDEADDDSETYELLVSFLVDEQEYGLYIPLDPFFVVARMQGGEAVLVEGEEFERVQPRIEAELEEREGLL
ncbi:MAG: DUF3727 domain-containing protein [Prochlorococcaceae cyanobacterium]|jgi:hypothetical protein